jgi:pimeloyl-ACP methyl ester carboxylesterase
MRRLLPCLLAVASLSALELRAQLPAGASAPATSSPEPAADVLEATLARIRQRANALLATPQPALFARHLHSVVALCEEEVLRLRFAGAQRDGQAQSDQTAQNDQTKEVLRYLAQIDAGLRADGARAERYLTEGRRALSLARISKADGTLQFYTVSLPAHWDAAKAYPLSVELHGHWSDFPLALVADKLAPIEQDQQPNEQAIIVVPWLRGNGTWREDNGSEPDVWEAIEDVKRFARLDPDRWYLSGHSWGGDDVWAIVHRTPDLWAAAGILSGDPGSVPRELGLTANLRYVPFYLWLGDQDPIPDRKPDFEAFRDALASVGDMPKLVIAQGVAHNPRSADHAALQSWLCEHVRHRPEHFTFVVDTPQHRGVWGITVPKRFPNAYGNAEPQVHLECWIEASTVRIQSPDAKQLAVDFGASGLNLAGNVTLIVNGTTRFTGPAPAKPISLEP